MTRKAKLPYPIRVKIMELRDKKYSFKDICDEIRPEVAPLQMKPGELENCVIAIIGHHAQGHRPDKRLG